MAELLEATRKMTKYFKRSFKHNKPHSNHPNIHTTSTNHHNNSHSDKHKHKPCNNNDEVNEITNSKHTSKNTLAEPENNKECYDSDCSDSILDSSSDSEWLSRENKLTEVKLSNTKYTTDFPVTINNNETISQFDTGTTSSYMPKACFDKLDPKPKLTDTHTHIKSMVPMATVSIPLAQLPVLWNSPGNCSNSSWFENIYFDLLSWD